MSVTFVIPSSLAFANTTTKENMTDPITLNAKAAMVTDMETGKILYSKNIDEALGIASMTKILTAYLVYDAIKQGKIKWTDTVPISEELIKTTENPELSNVPLYKDKTYTVQDLLHASLISSANAATSALAEFIGGTEPKFVDMMRAQLANWNIKDATLISSSGLGTMYLGNSKYPGSPDDEENKLSARDITIVADHLLTDFPEVLDITKLPDFTLFKSDKQETLLTNSNNMLSGKQQFYEGIDGLKTGTTDVAGNCFIGTLEKDGRRYISVVMGVDNQHSRFEETKNMLDFVFTNWKFQDISTHGQPASISELPVSLGKEDTVHLKIDGSAEAWIYKDTPKNTLAEKTNFTKTKKNNDGKPSLTAPVKKDFIVGNEVFSYSDALGFLFPEQKKDIKLSISTTRKVEKVNIFVEVWHNVTVYFKNL
ncbi:serine hydrolase [Vagococcus vulneris]|nr:serine hydrolase [Vagococcus vulneris]